MRSCPLFLLVAIGLGCADGTQPAGNEATSQSSAAPLAIPVGETFLVFTSTANVQMGDEVRATLSRGDTVQAVGFEEMADTLWVYVRVPGAAGEVEGWVPIGSLYRCGPLAVTGCHVIPQEDGTSFEVRISQDAALRLSGRLQQIDEERIAEVVAEVVGPIANAAGSAAVGAATGVPGAAEAGGELAELACRAVIAAAKGNFAKFKADLAAAAGQGHVRIGFTPHVSAAGLVLNHSVAGRAAGALEESMMQSAAVPKELRGDFTYYGHIRKAMLAIHPATVLDSSCWTISVLGL
jgi:hypothetical protein